jgi:hypothetical protein
MAVVLYGFWDASRQGFGSTLQHNSEITYRHGQWARFIQEEEPSNFRELADLVYALEEAAAMGSLNHHKNFMLTNNTTAEAAFSKGTSSNRKLFLLMLWLRKLQMNHGVFLHFYHVSGKQMNTQGTYCLSRGCTFEGVMESKDMLAFVPFHLCPMMQQPKVKTWVDSWVSVQDESIWLEPRDWFDKGHWVKCAIWSLPPAAADVASEQVAKAILKHPHNMHIILIPWLMTGHWRKLLGKICDLLFCVPLGCGFWLLTEFEPLIVGVSFGLSRHRPWKLRGTLSWIGWRSNCQLCHWLISVGGGIFCGNFAFKRENWTPCHRAWCGPCYKLDLTDFPVERPKDEDGVEVLLSQREERRFLEARDGDNLCAPFQCEFCHFVNLCGRTPLEHYTPDIRLLKSINVPI